MLAICNQLVRSPRCFPSLSQFLSSVSSVRESSVIPPEEKDPASSAMQTHPLARDIWALGQLILTIDDELGEDSE